MAGAIRKPDVAFRLPTGSGKTLVGLLIAEWRRRKFNERALYVCSTKQLVNQVVAEAQTKYGMAKTVRAFTGSQKNYNSEAKAQFQSGEVVAVTSYGGLFNANTFFDEPNLIPLDDAHAAENYLAGFWTVAVGREEHQALYGALALPGHFKARCGVHICSLTDLARGGDGRSGRCRKRSGSLAGAIS